MTKRSFWFSLRSSLWLIPVLSLAAGATIALGAVQIDLHFGDSIRRYWPPFVQPGPDGARQVLSIIANSMINVAGVLFSITIVALSLTANQYSPRVLRNFMRDRINQTVLGVFFGVFIYTVIVLQAVGSGAENFVPQLALWLGVLLAVVAIIFLIVFIHHTATSIQVSEIIAHIATETVDALEVIQKRSSEGGQLSDDASVAEQTRWQVICSKESGFIQDVDADELFRIACARKIVLRVECPVGDFVVAGYPLVSVGGEIEIDAKLTSEIQRLFGISSYRTIEQDPEFGVRQIVDIALRALSPGINDTTTAINCVDYLGLILHFAARVKPIPCLHVEGSEARLILQQKNCEHLIDVAFNEIRQNARDNVAIILRMLRALRKLLEDVEAPELRAHLNKHARLVGDMAEHSIRVDTDKSEVRRSVDRLMRMTGQGGGYAIAQLSAVPARMNGNRSL